jgi:hypothetical protein
MSGEGWTRSFAIEVVKGRDVDHPSLAKHPSGGGSASKTSRSILAGWETFFKPLIALVVPADP